MNIYGSRRQGPYHNGFHSHQGDPFVDTEKRIPESIRQFSINFGKPQFIFFRADLWDMHVTSSRNFSTVNDKKEHFQEYISNLLWAFDLIHQLLPNAVICTHTIPRANADWGGLLGDYMNALRFSADTKGIVLFDWYQMMAESTPSSYLRDTYHPDVFHSIFFIRMVSTALSTWMCISLPRLRHDLAMKIVGSNGNKTSMSGLLYLIDEQGLRHLIEPNATNSVMPSYLSRFEMVSFTISELEMITQSPVNLIILEEGVLFRHVSDKTVYYLWDGKKHPVHDGRIFQRHGWSFEDVKVIVSRLQFDIIPSGDAITS